MQPTYRVKCTSLSESIDREIMNETSLEILSERMRIIIVTSSLWQHYNMKMAE